MLTYREKILLDRTLGVAISIVISILARILGFLLKRDHSPAQNPPLVGVAKFVGLGSIVNSALLCQALKKNFPSTKLVYVTSRSCAPLVNRLRGVEEIITIDDRSLVGMVTSNMRLLFTLWKIRPDLYFDLEVYSAYSSILSNLSLARNRYGFYRKSVTFKKGLFTHPVFFNTRRHIRETYGEMARTAGLSIEGLPEEPLIIYPEDEEKAASFLSSQGWTKKRLVLVNPNASELMYERRWPQEHWAFFLREITSNWPDFIFALTGTTAEKSYVQEIINKLPAGTGDKVFNMAGRWDLGTFLAILKKAYVLVTVDSGPLHMAVALGVPTVSLWGPVEPDHYAPQEGNHVVIYRPPYCSPCLFHADVPPCGGNNVCMKNISPHVVLEATERFFRAEGEKA